MNCLFLVSLVVTLTVVTATGNNDIWSRLTKFSGIRDKLRVAIHDATEGKFKDSVAEANDVIHGVQIHKDSTDSSYSLSSGEDGGIEGPIPKQCCFPKRFAGKAGIATDVSTPTGMFTAGALARFAVDNEKQIWVMEEEIITEKSRMNVSNIIDMKAKIIYFLDREKKTCKRIKFPVGPSVNKLDSCIRKDAHYMGPGWLGAGRNSLRIDTWAVHQISTEFETDIRGVTVVTKDCIPVHNMVTGTAKGKKFTSFMNFMDVHTRVRDSRIFDIPSYCKTAPETDISTLTKVAGREPKFVNHMIR